MALRIEIQPDESVEVMHIRSGRCHFLAYPSLDRALIVVRFLLERELAEAAGTRFVPAFVKEARRAFKQLEERNPYHGKESEAVQTSRG